MSSPHDIYGVAGTPHSSQSAGQAPQGGPHYQPIYYQQQAPSAGCGAMLFRFAIGMVLLVVFGFFILFSIGVFGAAMMASMEQIASQENAVSEKFVSGNEAATQKIVILSIEGIITESEEGFIPKQIRQVIKDKDVKAVVLRVDSPGGTMSGSDYYHYLLGKIKEERDIPIIVSMGSIAASGGYYVSMVGDEIFAEPSTITGSIGVIVPLYKGVELCKKIGVESTPITSGPLKAMGNFSKPMSDEEQQVWQRLVDDSFGRFKQVIRDGRPEFSANPDKLDKLATGQIYTATEAVEHKLVDKIGYLDDAIKTATDRAGLSQNNSKAVRYKAKKKFIDVMLESRSPGKLPGVETLVDATTPRLYLLCPQTLPIRD